MTINPLPERINRLDELAHNMWWSWHEDARRLFRTLNYPLWKISVHNPVKLLREINPDTLVAAANDPVFLALYDSVMAAFDADMRGSGYTGGGADFQRGPVAYFSMEFAVHNSLPIYAGGLGILAGDICKEASDMGLPLVAVGFMFPQGYFSQKISAEGWQEEIYHQIDFNESPIRQVLSPEGKPAVAEVRFGDHRLGLGVWEVRVGRAAIYLLDTNLEENPAQYRHLSARLYVTDREQRLQQEIVLGIGGVRVLRALKINPVAWHANEGHTAFMMLERINEQQAAGASFAEAIAQVRETTVFTTHTPVQAGHDVFQTYQMKSFFDRYCEACRIDEPEFFRLGQDGSGEHLFNMTAFALRTTNRHNAVSQLHGKVARRMWHVLWPDAAEEQVPILHVTNGVHVPTWIAPELNRLFAQYLGKDWLNEQDNPKLWEKVRNIPDEELWWVHQLLKRKLMGVMREAGRARWLKNELVAGQLPALGVMLDPDVLTIGFTRRFAEYKRPTLIFRDIERLKRIINHPLHPVQIILAGKSHPADFPSKQLLHEVYSMATDKAFQGRISFVEDYDMHLAHYLVQGVDIWLNTPRRLQEACGTSGMKAALNGALHMSVLDGWWYEAYNGTNGWVINKDLAASRPEAEDEADAPEIYRLLEQEIVPLFYNRDRRGVPQGWIEKVKRSISSIAPAFSARRMLKEYAGRMYTEHNTHPGNSLLKT